MRAVFHLCVSLTLSLACLAASEPAWAKVTAGTLHERFQSFSRDFELAFTEGNTRGVPSYQQATTERAISELIHAHNGERWRDVIVQAGTRPQVGDGRAMQQEWLRAFALASALFWQRSYRSAAEVCAAVVDGIQRGSGSAEVRKIGNLCAFSMLKSVSVWGRQVDAGRDYGGFIDHPGWQDAVWDLEPAPLFIAAIGVLQGQGAPLALRTRVVHDEPQRSLTSARLGDAAWPVLQATLLSVDSAPAQALEVLAVENRGQDELKSGMARWLEARIHADLGRPPKASKSFAAALEWSVDALRRMTFEKAPHALRTVLASRLIVDATRELEGMGQAHLALDSLSRAADALRILEGKHSALNPWLVQLQTALLAQRARILSAQRGAPSERERAAVVSVFDLAIRRLSDLAGSLKKGGTPPKLSEHLRMAQGLGVRGRALDTVLAAEAWRAQSEADETVLSASALSLKLSAASLDPEQTPGIVWASAAFDFLEEYAQASISFAETLRLQMSRRSTLDSADDFSDQALIRVIRAAPVSLRQSLRAERALDEAAIAASTQDAGRAGIMNHVLGLLVNAPTADTKLGNRRESLIREAKDRVSVQEHERVAALYYQAADTVIERASELVSQVVARSKHAMSPSGREVTEAEAARLCLGLHNAYAFLVRALESERDWREGWRIALLEGDWQLGEVGRLRLSSERRLQDLLSLTEGEWNESLQKAIGLRQALLAESMIHAQSAGLMSTQSLADSLVRLRQVLGQAGAALDAAHDQGGLR